MLYTTSQIYAYSFLCLHKKSCMRIFGDRIITEKKRSGFEVLYVKRSFAVYNKTKVLVTNRIITEKKRSFAVYNKIKVVVTNRIITEKKRSGFEVLYVKRSFVVYNKTKVVVTNRIITEKKQSGFEVLYGKRSFAVYNKIKHTK